MFIKILITFFFFFIFPLSGRFPDCSDPIPTNYLGPLFSLSQDYPKTLPESEKPWERYDFKTEAPQYMHALWQYITEGMIKVDWVAQENQHRNWYHVPWMHVGRNPREFIHGMTRERDSQPFELCKTQEGRLQNWGIVFYNEYGGYSIGKVWENPNDPDPELCQFPTGTIVFKLLFTNGTVDQVPALEGAFEWDANINSTTSFKSAKQIQKVRLLQIDVAVRDARADETTGWVFGAFTYDKDAVGNTPWEKMIPIGVSWGNDPEALEPNVLPLQETRIFEEIPQIAKSHLGWGGRLNGPFDHPRSSCISCHSTAQWPRTSGMVAPMKLDTPAKWFRNLKPHEPFDEGNTSLDYSLQMATSLENFYKSKQNTPELEQIKLFLLNFGK